MLTRLRYTKQTNNYIHNTGNNNSIIITDITLLNNKQNTIDYTTIVFSYPDHSVTLCACAHPREHRASSASSDISIVGTLCAPHKIDCNSDESSSFLLLRSKTPLTRSSPCNSLSLNLQKV